MIFLASAHSYSLPVPASIAASLPIDQCQIRVQKLIIWRCPSSAYLRMDIGPRRSGRHSCKRYCIAERSGMQRGREPAVSRWMKGNRGGGVPEGRPAKGYELSHWDISRFNARSAAHAFPSTQAQEEQSPCRQSPLVQDFDRRGTTIYCVWEERSFVSARKPTVNGGLSRAAVCGARSDAWSRALRHPRHRRRYCRA